MDLTTPEIIIGIDLGTTNSLAAAVTAAGPEALCDPAHLQEGPIIPSVAARLEGHWLVGSPALPWRTQRPEAVVYSVKRLMGHGVEELSGEIGRLAYRVEPAQRELCHVVLEGERFTPQEVSAQILMAVKARAQAALDRPVHKAVVTVPAYFDDAQRQATRDAGRLAGLEVVRIINEPTAAAVAYGLDQKGKGLIAVYDLGGGTLDVTLLHLKGPVFKVLATHGNTHLGGDDFDQLLAQWLGQRALAQNPAAQLDSPEARSLLRHQAESLKVALSSSLEAPYAIQAPQLGIELRGVLGREAFEALIEPLVEQTLESCRQALAAAGKQPGEVEEVVLVGGSTRIPLVRHRVEAFFGRRPNVAINPDEVVAVGAAIQGHLLAGGRRDFVLLDVVPLALGLETLGGTFTKLINGNATVPAQASELFTTSADNQTGVELNIYQGEREFVKDCRNLGRFKLKNLPPMPAGLPKVKVDFLVDANGILTVSAVEERSGRQATIEVVPSHGLTPREIEAMLSASVDHAVEDMTQRQLVEFRLMARQMFTGIEKSWETAKTILNEQEQQTIIAQMEAVKEAYQGNDPAQLKDRMDALGLLTKPLADELMSRAALDGLKHRLSSPE